jgi:hypothetical protein
MLPKMKNKYLTAGEREPISILKNEKKNICGNREITKNI